MSEHHFDLLSDGMDLLARLSVVPQEKALGLGTLGAALRRLIPLGSIADVLRRMNEEPFAWWVELVESEFAFLAYLGFKLAKIHLHHQGNYVKYRSPEWVVYVGYEPESTRDMDVTMVRTSELRPDSNPRFRSLRDIARDEAIEISRPPRDLDDREAVGDTLNNWASALRQIADQVFGSGFGSGS